MKGNIRIVTRVVGLQGMWSRRAIDDLADIVGMKDQIDINPEKVGKKTQSEL